MTTQQLLILLANSEEIKRMGFIAATETFRDQLVICALDRNGRDPALAAKELGINQNVLRWHVRERNLGPIPSRHATTRAKEARDQEMLDLSEKMDRLKKGMQAVPTANKDERRA